MGTQRARPAVSRRPCVRAYERSSYLKATKYATQPAQFVHVAPDSSRL